MYEGVHEGSNGQDARGHKSLQIPAECYNDSVVGLILHSQRYPNQRIIREITCKGYSLPCCQSSEIRIRGRRQEACSRGNLHPCSVEGDSGSGKEI